MAYVDQKNGPSPAGLASAIIVQASIGALVVAGLSVTQFVQRDEEREMEPIEYKLPPPPEPEPKAEPQPDQQPDVTQPPVTIPQPKFEFDKIRPDYETTEVIFDGPIVLKPRPEVEKPPAPPAPVPTFDPVSAKPRNDPGAWLSDRDYRASWTRRELTGVARFRLDIAATGKVTGCRILGSTGHSELDDATCALVQKRAKFEPARGPNGEPVAGSYISSVRWQLPE